MSVSDERPRAVVVLVTGDRRRVLVTVEHGVPCDLELVHRLLWLRLNAQRCGWSVLLEEVDDDLRELLDLVGVATWLTPR